MSNNNNNYDAKAELNSALELNTVLPVIRCFHCNKPLANDFELIQNKSYTQLIKTFENELLLTRYCCKMTIFNDYTKLVELKNKKENISTEDNYNLTPELKYESEDEENNVFNNLEEDLPLE